MIKRFELLGPSGVGKTTLYKEICQTPAKNRSYLTLKDAYKMGAIHLDIPVDKPYLWFYQQLLKMGWYSNKAHGLGKNVLYGMQGGNRQLKIDRYYNYRVSFNILLEYLKKEPPYAIRKRINDFDDKIEEYLILENALPGKHNILFDEGMLHKHPGITEYGHNKFSAEDLKKDPALNPTGIISCELDADTIFQQALERKKQGIYTFTQGPMNSDELKKHVENNVNFHKRKINFFKKINIPILDINPRDELDINMKKINIFFSSILE